MKGLISELLPEVVDPQCPYCQTKASEHEDNECLRFWIASHLPPEDGLVLKVAFGSNLIWFVKETGASVACEDRNFTDWQHAGPLLEEMKGCIDHDGCGPGRGWGCHCGNDESGEAVFVNAPSPTHAICRAWLIWKASSD